jgi:hypothetical protein
VVRHRGARRLLWRRQATISSCIERMAQAQARRALSDIVILAANMRAIAAHHGRSSSKV